MQKFTKFLHVLLLLLLVHYVQGQSTANYTFTTSTSGSLEDMSTGTTQLVGASSDQGVSSVTNIGFDFYFMGNRYTQFSASANGIIQLGGTVVSGSTYLASGGTVTSPKISAFGGDSQTGSNGKVHCKIIGTAPNRTLVIEFLNMNLYYVASVFSNDATYQVQISETSGEIKFIYGTMTVSSISSASDASPSIGFSTNTTANNVLSVDISTHTTNTTTFTENATSTVGTITSLSSTTNGSRRVYTFTPGAAPAAPTWQTPTSVTASGMTLNWIDNAINETGYIVLVSTDNINFSQQGSVLAANTSTLNVSALSPSTTYYWKIQAVREGTFGEATGNQTTSAAAEYYWVGATGGDWNTASNWNTAPDNTGSQRTTALTNDLLYVDGAGTTAGGALTISITTSQSIGGLKITNGTALTLQSNNTTTKTITLTGSLGDELDIPNSCSLILNNATQAVGIAFSTGTGMTGNIAGTLTLGGSTSNTLNTTGGTNTLVTVASTGIVNLASTANSITGSTSTLNFLDGATCNSSGATTGAPPVPLATWGTNSNLIITGLTSSSTAPTNAVQSFGNITYNCPASTATMSWFTTSTTAVVKGTLTIQATNTGRFRALTSGTLTINNLVINGGTFEAASTTGTVIVNNNFSISGGTLDLCSSTGNVILRVNGTFDQTGGIITESGTSTGSRIEFAGTTAQTVNLNNTSNTISYRIANNAGINLTGTMPITTGAGLIIASTAATPINGGTLTYTGTTTLTYNASTGNQTITANELKSVAGPTNLVINNTSAAPNNRVSMGSLGNTTISGTFTQTSGVLLLGDNDLTITGAISGTASATNFVATNGTGQLKKVFAATGSTTFPLGDVTGTDEASAVTLNYTALTGTSTVGVKAIDAQHPADASTDNYLSRYFSFTESGGSAYTYTLTLNYPSTDIVGTAVFTRINTYDGTGWTLTSSTVPTSTSATATGITTLLNSKDFTLRPATITNYTWIGGASASFAAAASWNPNRSTTDATDILTFDGNNIDGANGTGNVIATSIPTQTVGKIVFLNNANVSFQSATASNTLTIAGGAGTDLDIPTGCTLSINGSNSMTLTYSNTGNVANIAGTLTLAGSTSNTYNPTNAVTTVTGTVNNGGLMTSASATNLLFSANANYNHTRDGGTIPTANYNVASTVNILGTTVTAATPPATIGGNLVYNCTSQTGGTATSGLSFTSTLTTIGGNLTIQSTGTGFFQFGTVPTLTVAGITTISGGNLVANGGTLGFNGGFTMSGGSIVGNSATTISTTNYSQTGGSITNSTTTTSPTINVSGTFNLAAGATIQQTSTGQITIGLNGTSNQSVTLNGNYTTGIVNFTVNNSNGITLNTNFNISGTLTQTAGTINMGSNTLTVGTSTTSIGTWTYTAGRVIGKVAKWFSASPGTTNITFPVGDATTQRNAIVKFNSTTITTGGTLAVEFKNTDLGETGLPTTLSAQNIFNVSPSGYWTIDGGNGLALGATTYNATFDMTGFTKRGGDAITSGDLADLRIVKRTSGSGTWVGGVASSAGPSNLNAVAIASQTSFSEFGLGSVTAVALPVELVSFTGTTRGNANVIAWEAAVEQNVKHYTLEKSVDANAWTAVEVVKTNKAKSYTSIDNKPFANTYYRLKITNTDESTQYSKVISVRRAGRAFEVLQVSPNPTMNDLNLTIENQNQQSVTIEIIDMNGRMINSQTNDLTKGINQITLPMSNLNAGVYYIYTRTSNEVSVHKVIKQ